MQFGSNASCTMHLSQRGFQFICELEGISDPDKTILLRRHLRSLEDALNWKLTVPVTQDQFDALISLGKSIGIDALLNSTLLALVNKKRHDSAADLILRWTKVNGKADSRLEARRQQERALFKGELGIDR